MYLTLVVFLYFITGLGGVVCVPAMISCTAVETRVLSFIGLIYAIAFFMLTWPMVEAERDCRIDYKVDSCTATYSPISEGE